MPVRKDHSFGNIEFFQAKKEIKERFNGILTKLQKTVERNGHAVQTVQRFRGCLENPEQSDVSRLPFYSDVPFSRVHHKISCVLCVLSHTIQLYWSFCTGNQGVRKIIAASLCDLENYTIKGLKAYRTVKHSLGYYLEEIK